MIFGVIKKGDNWIIIENNLVKKINTNKYIIKRLPINCKTEPPVGMMRPE